jgi:hypothetical protein
MSMPSILMGPVRLKDGNFQADTFIRLCLYFGLGITQTLTNDVRRAFTFGHLTDLNNPEHEYWGRWTIASVRHWMAEVSSLKARGGIVINERVVSIRKRAIDALHRQAFGYGAQVDPLRHRGLMVEKSDQNYKHDGRIIEGPAPRARPDRMYMTLVDAVDDEGCQVDYRTIVSDSRMIACVIHRRPWQERFGMNSRAIELIYATPEEVFSRQEIRCLEEFIRLQGLDFGEMDVLRDRHTGLIFVVDVNSTPGSGRTVFAPPGELSLPCASPTRLRRSASVPEVWRQAYLAASESMILGRVLKSGRRIT